MKIGIDEDRRQSDGSHTIALLFEKFQSGIFRT